MGKVLIVQSGGGFAQIENSIGALCGLENKGLNLQDKDIHWKCTSAGAIVACLINSGYSARYLKLLIKQIPSDTLIWKRWFWMIRMFFNISIYNRTGISKLIDEIVGKKEFDNVTCIATKLKGYERVELIGSAISCMASSAIHKIFEPVKINGEKHIDGGYTDNVPFDPYDISKYDQIYIILYPKNIDEDKKAKTWIGSVLQEMSLKMSQEINETERLYSDKNKFPNVTLIRPPPIASSLLNWSRGYKVVENAEKFVEGLK